MSPKNMFFKFSPHGIELTYSGGCSYHHLTATDIAHACSGLSENTFNLARYIYLNDRSVARTLLVAIYKIIEVQAKKNGSSGISVGKSGLNLG